MSRSRRTEAGQPASEQLDLATRAAWLSYIGGYTQNEVARRLGVSPAKAHRLIALAQQQGLVKVFVEGEPARCVALEERLIRTFGLQSCIVAPDLEGDSESEDFREVGAASARLMHRLLQEESVRVVGVGKGRSLTAMAEALPALPRPDLKFVSVSGSLTRTFAANRLDVIHRLAALTGGDGYFLPVPYIAADVRQRDLLVSQQSVQEMLNIARRADLYAIGIGSLHLDAYLQSVGLISEAQWRDLHGAGAVCDLIGCFVDLDGQPVDCALSHCQLGLEIEELRGKRVLAIAGGHDKGIATLAALRTGILTDLVMGERSARDLIAALDGAPQPSDRSSDTGSLP